MAFYFKNNLEPMLLANLNLERDRLNCMNKFPNKPPRPPLSNRNSAFLASVAAYTNPKTTPSIHILEVVTHKFWFERKLGGFSTVSGLMQGKQSPGFEGQSPLLPSARPVVAWSGQSDKGRSPCRSLFTSANSSCDLRDRRK